MSREQHFCILPFTHLHMKPSGGVRMCCMQTVDLHEQGEPLNVYRNSIEHIWHSEALTDARRRMAAGQPVEQCANCYRDDAVLGTSPRSMENAMWERHAPPGQSLEAIMQTGKPVVPEVPVFYQLDMGSLCNLKCRMCTGRNSSRIAADPVYAAWEQATPDRDGETTRWRGDRVSLLPRFALGVRYGNFGARVYAADGKSPRAFVGAGSIDVPAGGGDQPVQLSVTPWAGNPGLFLGTIEINGEVLHRNWWAPGATIKVDIPSRLLEAAGDLKIRLAASSSQRDAAVWLEDVSLYRRGASSRDAVRNARAFTRFSSGRAWHDEPAFVDEILARPNTLRQIKFQGGEPMLIPTTEVIIDRLIGAGAEPTVQLEFVTNATVYRDDLIEKVRRFRTPTVWCSIDGVDATFDYIRVGGVWPETAAIIDRYRAVPELEIQIATACQVYNLFNLVALFAYFDRQDLTVHPYFVTAPPCLDVRALPPAVRQLALDDLRRYADQQPAPRNLAAANYCIAHLAETIEQTLPDLLPTLFAFTNDLDVANQQSIRQACPQLVAALAAVGIPWANGLQFAKRPAIAG
jgi:glutamate-1-semialdehyde 2,1-aminomutase